MKVVDIKKKEIKASIKTFQLIVILTWWPVETFEKKFLVIFIYINLTH